MANEEIYQALRQRMEKVAGRKIKTPKDFDYLTMHIFNALKVHVAPITLKRFWGYVGRNGNGRKPFRSTLNAFAQYVGYTDIDAFANNINGKDSVESDFILNDTLLTQSLAKSTRIELRWHPNRRVVIKHEGMEMFKVLESANSKLKAGDTFLCGQIIDGEPLTLRYLVQNGNSPVNYVCGRVNGVKYKLLHE